jgi:hypothetical protein
MSQHRLWVASETVGKVAVPATRLLRLPRLRLLQAPHLKRHIAGKRAHGSSYFHESTNLHPVFLGEWWNDTVQAQVLD